MVERFAKERARETKANKFQLGDDDEDGDDLLTHGGKAIRLGLLLFVVVSTCIFTLVTITNHLKVFS